MNDEYQRVCFVCYRAIADGFVTEAEPQRMKCVSEFLNDGNTIESCELSENEKLLKRFDKCCICGQPFDQNLAGRFVILGHRGLLV